MLLPGQSGNTPAVHIPIWRVTMASVTGCAWKMGA